jgi:hypothetical protein
VGRVRTLQRQAAAARPATACWTSRRGCRAPSRMPPRLPPSQAEPQAVPASALLQALRPLAEACPPQEPRCHWWKPHCQRASTLQPPGHPWYKRRDSVSGNSSMTPSMRGNGHRPVKFTPSASRPRDRQTGQGFQNTAQTESGHFTSPLRLQVRLRPRWGRAAGLGACPEPNRAAAERKRYLRRRRPP